jgi:hypothetical protein
LYAEHAACGKKFPALKSLNCSNFIKQRQKIPIQRVKILENRFRELQVGGLKTIMSNFYFDLDLN